MKKKPAAVVAGVLVWCMLSTTALAVVDIDDVEKTVYANGHAIVIKEDSEDAEKTIVTSEEKDAVRESDAGKNIKNYTVYGGSKQKDITGDTSVTVESGTVKDVYGGSGAGTVRDSADITGSTSVTITGGTVTGSVYGGSEGRLLNDADISGSTEVVISGGTVNGSVYGGSKNGGVGGDSSVAIENATVGGTVYGGSENGNIEGDTSVSLADSTAKEVYGGSEKGNVQSTDVTVDNSATGNVYGGSKTGNVTGDAGTSVSIINGAKTGKVYGGGKTGSAKKTQITVGGEDTSVNTVFAGSEKAGITMSAEITLEGGNVTSKKVFGWGGNDLLAPVGPVNVNIFTENGAENTYYLSRLSTITVGDAMMAYKLIGEDGYYIYAPFTFAARATRAIPVKTVYQDKAGNVLFTMEESVTLMEGYTTSLSYQSWNGAYANANKYKLTGTPADVAIAFEDETDAYTFTVVAEAISSDEPDPDLPLGIPQTGDGPFAGYVIAALALMSLAAAPTLKKRLAK